MKVVSSYGVHIQDHRKALKATVDIYRAATAFVIDVANKEWDTLGPIYKKDKRLCKTALEALIHKTAKNPEPKYDFDGKFYKMPTYFRRAVQAAALGAVSSYRSSLANWEAGGKQGQEPKLTYDRNVMPVFFRDNMSQSDAMLRGETTVVQLKL